MKVLILSEMNAIFKTQKRQDKLSHLPALFVAIEI